MVVFFKFLCSRMTIDDRDGLPPQPTLEAFPHGEPVKPNPQTQQVPLPVLCKPFPHQVLSCPMGFAKYKYITIATRFNICSSPMSLIFQHSISKFLRFNRQMHLRHPKTMN